MLALLFAASPAWADAGDRQVRIDNALRALALSATNTLYALERLENVGALRRSGRFLIARGLLLTVNVQSLTRFDYDPPLPEIERLVSTRDFNVGEVLSAASARERETYLQQIADAIGDLNETNEKVATFHFEFLKHNVDREVAQTLQAAGMRPEAPSAIDHAREALLSFVNDVSGTHIIGDQNMLDFLAELLIMRPTRGEKHAAEYAVSLLEKLGDDPRLARSGLLAAFADDIAQGPGRLGQDPRLGGLVDAAVSVHRKMQRPLWHIACESILTPPRLN